MCWCLRAAVGCIALSPLLLTSCKEAPQENASQSGYVLPQPQPEFKGVVGTTYKDSTPDKIPIVNPPKGAPNVLVILIDDSGFGQWGTFGGLDRLAKTGISFL